MNPLEDLISDLVAENDLSVSLRKAKVLAYKLGNVEFKEWVENELNGYGSDTNLPKYRKVVTIAQGDFINARWKITGQLIPTTHVPKEYRAYFSDLHLTQGAKELESMLRDMNTGEGSLKIAIPPEISALLHSKVYEYTQCMRAWRVLNSQTVVRILDTTRNRLLTFALELVDKFPQLKGESVSESGIADEQITQLFNITINGGNVSFGGVTETTIQTEVMTTFNQQGQNVGTQYNAGGDINFGDVKDKVDFVKELNKLRAELSRVAVEDAIDAEIITDADYQLTKAIQQAEKDAPDKSKLLLHLESAKGYMDGITSLLKLAAAVGAAITTAGTIF